MPAQYSIKLRLGCISRLYTICWLHYPNELSLVCSGLQVYCLEIEPYMLQLAQPKFEAAGVADRIEVLVGSATDSIEKLLKQGVQFDIAFLDADKTGYLGYYKQLMDNQLISSGGIVVVDNALMKVSWLS